MIGFIGGAIRPGVYARRICEGARAMRPGPFAWVSPEGLVAGRRSASVDGRGLGGAVVPLHRPLSGFGKCRGVQRGIGTAAQAGPARPSVPDARVRATASRFGRRPAPPRLPSPRGAPCPGARKIVGTRGRVHGNGHDARTPRSLDAAARVRALAGPGRTLPDVGCWTSTRREPRPGRSSGGARSLTGRRPSPQLSRLPDRHRRGCRRPARPRPTAQGLVAATADADGSRRVFQEADPEGDGAHANSRPILIVDDLQKRPSSAVCLHADTLLRRYVTQIQVPALDQGTAGTARNVLVVDDPEAPGI